MGAREAALLLPWVEGTPLEKRWREASTLALKVSANVDSFTTKMSKRDVHLVETGRMARRDRHILLSGRCEQGGRGSEINEAIAQHKLKLFDERGTYFAVFVSSVFTRPWWG